MNQYEQLILIDVDLYKGRIYGLNESERCPHCHVGKKFVVDSTYEPPDGIDNHMLKVKCLACDKDYYIVRSKK